MSHTATALAVASTCFLAGFFGWRFVRALLENASGAWLYLLGFFAVVVLVQSVKEIEKS